MTRRRTSQPRRSEGAAGHVTQPFRTQQLRHWALPAAIVAILAAAGIFWVASPPAGPSTTEGPPGVIRASDFHALAFSPTEPEIVFFGHHDGIMRSDDGGRTWRPLVSQRNFDAMGIAVGGTGGQRLYLAGHDVFQQSDDGGASRRPVSHNLPGTDIHGFAVSPLDSARLYAFVVGHRVFRSGDGGRRWERLPGQLPGDVMSLAALPGEAEALVAGTMRSGVLKSADGGASWQPANSGLQSASVMALGTPRVDGGVLYATGAGGIYRTDNAGGTWRALPFPGSNPAILAVAPKGPNTIVVIDAIKEGEGHVYRSDDGGNTWADLRRG